MWTAIIEKTGGAVLHVYQGAPHPSEDWDAHFANNMSNPNLVDHVEIPDPPGPAEDYYYDGAAWLPRMEDLRARKEGELKRAAWEEVFDASPTRARFNTAMDAVGSAATPEEVEAVKLKK